MSNKFEYFGNSSDADVVIQAGELSNFKRFLVHSRILKEKSPYFRVALSTTWAKKEDERIILKKPNITHKVFQIILKYFYTGNLPLDQQDGSTILDLLIASDELLISELLDRIQDHLLNVKTEWLNKNFSSVLHEVFERETCKNLKDHCMNKICWDPKIILDGTDFEDSVLIALLKLESLQIEEIELWDYLIKWGIAQLQRQKEYFEEERENIVINTNNNINNDHDNNNNNNNNNTIVITTTSSDLSNWNKQDLLDLGNILKDCFPLIRFSEFSLGEFYDKVWPLKDILPSELRQNITDYQTNPENLSPRKPIISIDSDLIRPQQASKFPDWIDAQTNSSINSRLRYEFKLLLRGSRDGFTPKVFHEKCDHKGPNIVLLRIRGSGQVIGGYNPIGWRSLTTNRWQYTKDSFLFSFGSNGNIDDAKLSRVTPGSEAIYDDPSFGPCFGKTDLDMRRQFNEPENCSAISISYKNVITSTSKFAVDDYEVFQVLCHNLKVQNDSFFAERRK